MSVIIFVFCVFLVLIGYAFHSFSASSV